MKEYALAKQLREREPELGKSVDQYYSVEFSFEGLDVIYQFKIWKTVSTVMSVLVKEDSGILPWLKVGDKLNMKYYSTDVVDPFENLNTYDYSDSSNNKAYGGSNGALPTTTQLSGAEPGSYSDIINDDPNKWQTTHQNHQEV